MKRPLLWKKRAGIWYFRLADEVTFHSTGLADRAQAERLVFETPDFRVRKPKLSRAPTLRAFASGFFKWGICPWIRRQHAKGRSFGSANAAQRRAHLEKWILPAFGDRALTDLRKPEIETWLVGLDLANQTKNHILYTLRIVLREAEDAGLLKASPLARVEALGKAFRPRDVFSAAELRKLFPTDREELTRIWARYQHAVMFLVMATAGLRVGEARAIQWRQVLAGDRALLVDRAIKADETVGGTKTGETRVVVLPSRTLAELAAWREQALWSEPEDLVFPGADRGTPVSRAAVSHRLTPAMERAGIAVAGRNLVAHSFRHTYNTAMRRLVPGDLLRALTGHKSIEMSERYDHPALEARLRQIEGAHDAAEKLLGG